MIPGDVVRIGRNSEVRRGFVGVIVAIEHGDRIAVLSFDGAGPLRHDVDQLGLERCAA